ncbi:MAG: DNA repair protein RadA, partial [Actinobacteria bacterium]|nr:DNA repair protein RadA [Actinomycetota bacterium]
MASRTKSRSHTSFRCTDCGQVTPVWNGRCNGCEGWNTLEATVASAVPLAQVSALRAAPTPVGIGEVDRVLGGGLVPGSVTLLSGPPGVGKSTLSLQLAAGSSSTVLYVAAEETVAQVRLRADRLGVRAASSLLVTERGDVDQIVAAMTDARPDLVIIDSIQAVHDPSIESTAGSVAQVRACAQRLAAVARETGTALVIVGHVTKDGSIAGPRLLEHLVDTVVTFDADLDHALRFLRAIKHRFGPVGELGVFTMGSDGLNGVPDVGAMFLEGRRRGVPGSVVTPVTEGRRSLVVEVQALVDASGS